MTAVVFALLESQGRFFLQRRDPAASVLPGAWEFPGGKVEAGESLVAALLRELQEELGISLQDARELERLDGEPSLHPFRTFFEGQPRTKLAWGWFTLPEMQRLPIPPRNLFIISRIQEDEAGSASVS